MKRIIYNIGFFFLFLQVLRAQENSNSGVAPFSIPIRNSLKFNRFVVNPAFSYAREQNSYITVYNKRELIEFADAPQTYLLSYSGRFRENQGLALGLFQQNYGVLTTFGGVANFAQNVYINQDSNLTFGLNLAFYKSGINAGSVLTNYDDPALQNIPSSSLITINPGINYGTAFLDFGLAINNAVLYNLQTSEVVKNDPAQGIQGHIMYTGYVDNNGFFDKSKFSALFRAEARKEQTVISGLLMFGIPKGIWAQAGYSNLNGVSGGVGLNITSKIALEYNYERAIGAFTQLGPSHEITLAYRFSNKFSDEEEEEGAIISASEPKPVLAPKTVAKPVAVVQKPVDPNALTAKEIQDNKLKARAEAEQKIKDLAEQNRLKREQAIADAAAKAKLAADARAQALADSKAARELALKNKVNVKPVAASDSKVQAEEQARLKAAADAKAKAEEEARQKAAADAKAKAEEEARQKAAADAKAKAEEQARIKAAAEAKAKAEEEARQKAAAAAKLSAEEQARLKAAADAKAKAEEEARQKAAAAKLSAEEQARLKAAADAKAQAEEKARIKAAAEAKAKAEEEARQKAAADAKAKAEEQARLKAANDAKAKAEEEARQKAADAKAQAEEQARIKAAVEAKAKAEEEARQKAAAAKAQAEEQARLKAAADAKAQAEEQARIKAAADAKAKAEEEARQKAAAAKAQAEEQARIKAAADAKAKAEEDARQKAAAAKAQAEEQARIKAAADAKAKAEEDARQKAAAAKAQAEEQARIKAAAEAKAKAEEDARQKAAAAKAQAEEQARIKAVADAKAKAEEDARQKAAAAKAQAEEQARIKAAAEAKAKAEEDARQKAAAAKAQAEEQARLKAAEDAKAKAEEDARQKAAAAAALAAKPKDENLKSMDKIAETLDGSIKTQSQLLTQLQEKVSQKQKELQDLRKENDLGDQGVVAVAKEFKSSAGANAAIDALKADIEAINQNQKQLLDNYQSLYNERVKKVANKNDEITLSYLKSIEDLKAEQSKALVANNALIQTLEEIKVQTDIEKRRRIKRANFQNEDDRYAKDMQTLKVLKQTTRLSATPLKVEDFDFGNEQVNMQIIKNIKNVEAGFYMVYAVHSDVAKRDDFVTKTLASGDPNVGFFYDVKTTNYFIYSARFDSLDAATSTLQSKGSKPYNSKMVIIKVEN